MNEELLIIVILIILFFILLLITYIIYKYYPSNLNPIPSITILDNEPSLLLYYTFEPSTIQRLSLGSILFDKINYNASILNFKKIIGISKYGYNGLNMNSSSSYSVKINPIKISTNGLSFSFWFLTNKTKQFNNIFYFDNITCFIYYKYIICNIDNKTFPVLLNIDDNEWFHFVWTISTDGSWIYYINGRNVSNEIKLIYPNKTILNINYLNYNPTTNLINSKNYMDDFRLYNKVLNVEEILILANGLLNNAPIFQLYYTFDPESIDELKLSNYITYSYVNNSTIKSISLNTNDFKVDTSSLLLTDNTQHIMIDSIIITNNGISFIFWFKTTDISIDISIFNFNNIKCFITTQGIKCSINNISKIIYFSNNNDWTHFTWTINNDNLCLFYINSTLIDMETKFAYPKIGTFTNCYIGDNQTNNINNFNLGLDDFRMYNTVLDNIEIESIFYYQNN